MIASASADVCFGKVATPPYELDIPVSSMCGCSGPLTRAESHSRSKYCLSGAGMSRDTSLAAPPRSLPTYRPNTDTPSSRVGIYDAFESRRCLIQTSECARATQHADRWR